MEKEEMMNNEHKVRSKAAYHQMISLLENSTFEAPVTYEREKLKELLQAKLEPGEKIIWSGQPDPDLAARRSARYVWFILAVFVGFVAMFIVNHTGLYGFLWKALGAAVAMMFVRWGIESPEFALRLAKTTLYAVTDKQVVKMLASDPKNRGKVSKWVIFRFFNDTLIEPQQKKIKDSKRSDITFALSVTEDSRQEQTFENVIDADGLIAALQKLRQSL